MKLQLFILMSLFSISSYSLENVQTISSSSSSYAESGQADFSSMFFTLGYKNGSSSINHNETSSTPGFIALNNTSSITKSSIDLGIMKEFFSDSSFSLSLLASVGISRGQDKGSVLKSNLNFSDKLSGNQYSFGGSLNLNKEAFKIRIQPFIYSSISKANLKYSLNYSQGTSNLSPTTIEYKNDIQQTDIGAGIRFIDPKVQLMSYLSVNYGANIKKTTESSSINSNGKVDLVSSANVDLKPITFSIGFGFFF